jgi:hypothetical protein
MLCKVGALYDSKIDECSPVLIRQAASEVWNVVLKMITHYAALISSIDKFMVRDPF